jgi:F-type H+-transporting ATPase subunit b
LEQLAPLGINLGYLFLQIVNFLVLVLLLWAIAFGPMTKMLRERRERIADGLNNARRAEEALASAEADKQKLLDEARIEAQRITADARSRAEEAAVQIKSEAQAEARRMRDLAQTEAGTEKDRVMTDVRDQIVSLSIAAAGHLLKSNLDDKKQHESVQAFFSNVPAEAKSLGKTLVVISALPLNADEQKKFKKELDTEEITFRVDPSILGGVIVRGGGQQVDASYASQLQGMRSSLA